MPLVVIAGPSGVGKNSIVDGVVERIPGIWVSVSVTTRDPRPGEVDGNHYHFVTDSEFDRLRDSGELLEWFQIYGHRSGTPRRPVEAALAGGRMVLLWLDVQGALAVKQKMPEAVLIFVKAPSREEQRRRLEARGDPVDAIERRLATAEREEAQSRQFDHVVVNEDLDRAIDEVAAIIEQVRSGAA